MDTVAKLANEDLIKFLRYMQTMSVTCAALDDIQIVREDGQTTVSVFGFTHTLPDYKNGVMNHRNFKKWIEEMSSKMELAKTEQATMTVSQQRDQELESLFPCLEQLIEEGNVEAAKEMAAPFIEKFAGSKTALRESALGRKKAEMLYKTSTRITLPTGEKELHDMLRAAGWFFYGDKPLGSPDDLAQAVSVALSITSDGSSEDDYKAKRSAVMIVVGIDENDPKAHKLLSTKLHTDRNTEFLESDPMKRWNSMTQLFNKHTELREEEFRVGAIRKEKEGLCKEGKCTLPELKVAIDNYNEAVDAVFNLKFSDKLEAI